MGHRSNLFLVKDGRILGGGNKQITGNMPGLVALGEFEVISWLKSQGLKEDFQGEIWDEVMAEAAIMVNLDHNELIFGFWEWFPGYIPDRYLDTPYMGDILGEMFTEFIGYPDMWSSYFEIVQKLWAGWQIELALPAEFGVQEMVITRIQDLKTPKIRDVAFPPTSGLSEIQKQLGFYLAFALALGEESVAYQRLIS